MYIIYTAETDTVKGKIAKGPASAKAGPFFFDIYFKGERMEYIYKEIKEEKRCRGCVTSRLFIRYPTDTGNEKLNGFIQSEVDAFKGFITEKAFTDGENQLNSHLSAGGRRCAFSPTTFQLIITASDIGGGLLRIVTEAGTEKGGRVAVTKSYSEIFNARSGYLYRKSKK